MFYSQIQEPALLPLAKPQPSFLRSLRLSFALLAGLAVIFAGFAWQIFDLTAERVLRSRASSDLMAEFLELRSDRRLLQLRIVSGPDPAQPLEQEASALLDRMEARLDRIGQLAKTSRSANGTDDGLDADARRQEQALASLRGALARKRVEVMALARGEPPAAEQQVSSPTLVDDGFGGILDRSIAAEETAIERKRAAVNGMLAELRIAVWVSISAFIAISLGMAFLLSRRLQAPIQLLSKGLRAMRAGELSHRIPVLREDEFGGLADDANTMAAELRKAQESERQLLASLESEVSLRTADLRRALADLEQTELRRRELMGNIGHELRTPLTVLHGEAQVALRKGPRTVEEYQEVLGQILMSSRQLGRMIDDLLMLAREEDASLTLSVQPLNPEMEVKAAIRLFGGNSKRTRWLPSGMTSRRVMADPLRLQQAAGALLDNALHYSDSTVKLASRWQDGQWSLAVIDEGIGIDPEDLPHVRDRSYRGALARERRPGGLGLGLAITEDLIVRMGGSLHLETGETGRGTIATLTLPEMKPA